MNGARAVVAAGLCLGGLLAGPAAGQEIVVPPGTTIAVEVKAPIEASGAGTRFAGVLVADVVVDFMLVASSGETCAGRVVQGDRGALTLEITELRRPDGRRRIVARTARYGTDPSPAPSVVGFAGSLAQDHDRTSRIGRPVSGVGGRLDVPAGTVLEFSLAEAWKVPLLEAESVFPQPEGAAVPATPQGVPRAWYAHVDRAVQERQRQQQRPTRSVAYRRGYGSRWSGRGRSAYAGSPWPVPNPPPLKQMTPGQRAAVGFQPATLPVGTMVITRTIAAIDSSKVEPGAEFPAVVMTDIVAAGRILFPRGAPARGMVTVGQLGADVVPTLALLWLQLGGTQIAVRTGPVKILHLPARTARCGCRTARSSSSDSRSRSPCADAGRTPPAIGIDGPLCGSSAPCRCSGRPAASANMRLSFRPSCSPRRPGSFDRVADSGSDGLMTADPAETAQLLERWHAGDRAALDELLQRNVGWIEAFVRRRLGPEIRAKEETFDAVQDAVVDILTYGPRFVVSDGDRFRALLGRMVENNLRDKHAFYKAHRRNQDREVPFVSESVLHLDGASRDTPSQAAVQDERAEFVRLALELLAPEDREVIVLREYDGLSFPEIAERLELTDNAARMRYQRALPRLARRVTALRRGELEGALDDGERNGP